MWEVPFVLATIVFFLHMAALVSGGAKLKERGVIMVNLGAPLVVLRRVSRIAARLRPEDVS